MYVHACHQTLDSKNEYLSEWTEGDGLMTGMWDNEEGLREHTKPKNILWNNVDVFIGKEHFTQDIYNESTVLYSSSSRLFDSVLAGMTYKRNLTIETVWGNLDISELSLKCF